MSYILDALKKAERERGMAKVPTLETIHAAVPDSGKVRRAAIGYIIILLAAVAGLYIYSRSGSGPRHSPAGDIALQDGGSGQANAVVRETDVRQDQAGLGQRLPASDLNSRTAPLEGTRDLPDPSTAQNRRPATISNPSTGYAPLAPAAGNPYEDRPEDSSRPAVEESPVNRITATPSAGESPLPTSLSEAVGDMRVTIHLYSDFAENRKIFIDGKKYAEGDYIDGIYLIEAITPEGAVLSYQGTRAVIKAAE